MTFGLYIHFPFCLAKCGYCDFASSAVEPLHIPHEAYADAVLRELAWRAADYGDLALRSIYIGGGTPSLWAARDVARIVRAACTAWRAADEGVEVTLEVNPATVEASGLARLRDTGVSRLSVGVQSLSDSTLRLLGRIHTAEQARRCVRAARDAGMDNVSCDAIFGVPHQTVADHLASLRQLVELGPQHISTYALSLSADAPLRRAGLAPADDELLGEMMDAGRELLEAAGLPQYEVSNFAPSRWRSAHNGLVWAVHPYLGLGASAHSMIARGPTTLRVANPPVATYLAAELERHAAGIPTVAGAAVEVVGEPRSRYEALFLALRTVDGLDRRAYRERFGGDPFDHFAAIATLAAADLLCVDEARIAPTRRGIWLADEIVLRLMA
jgi:putative oxygen-independent coproporphyrinogen III oxidase